MLRKAVVAGCVASATAYVALPAMGGSKVCFPFEQDAVVKFLPVWLSIFMKNCYCVGDAYEDKLFAALFLHQSSKQWPVADMQRILT